jgi:hypothetical protein
MANNPRMRASDVDREAVVAALRDAYTAGRLTLAEFDERTTAAYAGKTWGDLRALTTDLPEKAELGADLPKPPIPPVHPLMLPAGRPMDMRPYTERVPQVSRRSRRRLRVLPIMVIAVIAGGVSHSGAVVAVIMLLGLVGFLAASFADGWHDRGNDRR